MDTEKKFGLAKWKALALFFQFILMVVGAVGTVYVLGFSIANNVGALFIISYAIVAVSYVAVVFYAVYGYKKDDRYYLGAVYAFCAAILLNVLLPFRTTYQLVALTVLLGLYVAFAQRLKDVKVAMWLLLCMLVFAVAFSVYSTITAKTDNVTALGGNFVTVLAMYASVWTPVIMTVTLGLAYSVRERKSEKAN